MVIDIRAGRNIGNSLSHQIDITEQLGIVVSASKPTEHFHSQPSTYGFFLLIGNGLKGLKGVHALFENLGGFFIKYSQ